MTNTPVESWEEEFDRKFEVLENGNPDGSFTLNVGDKIESSNERAKQFLRETLAKQKEEIVNRTVKIMEDYWDKLNKQNPVKIVSRVDIIKIIKGE